MPAKTSEIAHGLVRSRRLPQASSATRSVRTPRPDGLPVFNPDRRVPERRRRRCPRLRRHQPRQRVPEHRGLDRDAATPSPGSAHGDVQQGRHVRLHLPDPPLHEGADRRRMRKLAAAGAGIARPRGVPGAGPARPGTSGSPPSPTTWNVVPNGRNADRGRALHARQDDDAAPSSTSLHARLEAPAAPHHERLRASPGPLIKARVGDDIFVHFKNLDTAFKRPHSMHFHGVHYPFGSDGSFIPGFSGRGRRRACPARPSPTSCAPGQLRRRVALPRPLAVDDALDRGRHVRRDLDPAPRRAARRPRVRDRSSSRTLGFETINGRAFVGNTPVLHARVGDSCSGTCSRSATSTTPSTSTATAGRPRRHADRHARPSARGELLVPHPEDQPGTWLYHCHIEQHMMRGMIGLYRVQP